MMQQKIANSAKLGFTMNMRRGTAFRGAILLIALFSGLLCAPSLRNIWLVQITGHSPLYPGWGRVPFYGNARMFAITPQSSPTLSQALPTDDPRALAVALFMEASGAQGSSAEALSQTCSELDRLSVRFPQETWLLALRLRWSLQWMQHNRLAGELFDLDLASHRAQGLPSPEKTAEPPNFTRKQLNEALDCARRGQKAEPDNAFWDWMLAQLYVYGWRDAAAWHALENGARKTRFDSHEREWQAALLAEHERQLGRPLLVEEKTFVWHSSATSTQGGRGVGRLIAWQAVKAERRGDHTMALRILLALQRLQTLRARQAYSQRESYLATNIAVFALARAKPWNVTTLAPVWNLELEARQRGDDLIRYATAHRCGADARRVVGNTIVLARELELEQRDGDAMQQASNGAAWRTALSAYGASDVLWQQALVCGVLWLAIGVVWQLLALPHMALAPSDRVFGMLLVMCLLLGLAMGVGEQIAQVGGSVISVPSGMGLTSGALSDASSLLMPLGTAIPALFVSWLVQGLTLWRVSGQGENEPSWRERCGQFRPAALLSAFALSLFTLGMLVWWQVVLSDSTAVLIVPRAVSGFPLGPLGGHAIAYAALHPNWPLAAMLLGLAAGWMRWILSAAPHHRPVVLYRLCWLRELLLAATLFCAASFVVANIAATPARRAVEADFQWQLAHGDNPLLVKPAVQIVH